MFTIVVILVKSEAVKLKIALKKYVVLVRVLMQIEMMEILIQRVQYQGLLQLVVEDPC